MADILKLKSLAIAISNVTPNTVSSGVVVRVNYAGAGTSAVNVNIANSSGSVLSSVSINPQTCIFLQKGPTDTLATNVATSDMTATAIAFAQ